MVTTSESPEELLGISLIDDPQETRAHFLLTALSGEEGYGVLAERIKRNQALVLQAMEALDISADHFEICPENTSQAVIRGLSDEQIQQLEEVLKSTLLFGRYHEEKEAKM
ncbi:MAG: hypothetical protein WCX61_00720 [Candidatus Peribacteraceae bacterium]|jgi:uncharacterized protein YktB (UPF0637 family)